MKTKRKPKSLFLVEAARWLLRLKRKAANRASSIEVAAEKKPTCKIIEFLIPSTNKEKAR